MPRLLFEKKGSAIWISHLDLMRLFQRAFKRANLQLTHTQGYNPRPSVSIALPLSVGVASGCELLDFDLYGDKIPNDEIRDRLNEALVEGVRVLEVYDSGRKQRDLSLLQCVVAMEYDTGVPENGLQMLRDLFSRQQVIVPKRTKNGIQDQDVIPMIRRIEIEKTDDNTIEISALVCCQNPALNPMQLVVAVEMYLPELKPDFASCRRVEIFDQEETIFR